MIRLENIIAQIAAILYGETIAPHKLIWDIPNVGSKTIAYVGMMGPEMLAYVYEHENQSYVIQLLRGEVLEALQNGLVQQARTYSIEPGFVDPMGNLVAVTVSLAELQNSLPSPIDAHAVSAIFAQEINLAMTTSRIWQLAVQATIRKVREQAKAS